MSTSKSLPPCQDCGGKTARSRARLELSVNGEAVEVPGIPHLRCKDCGEAILTLEASGRLRREAHAAYREKHGLLAPEELIELREKLGISQVELGRLLHLGNNTVSRWETGRKVQSASMDSFLRVLRDVPGTAEYLSKRVA